MSAGQVQGPAEPTIEDLDAADGAGADAAVADAAWRTTFAAMRAYVGATRAELEADMEMEAGA